MQWLQYRHQKHADIHKRLDKIDCLLNRHVHAGLGRRHVFKHHVVLIDNLVHYLWVLGGQVCGLSAIVAKLKSQKRPSSNVT